ncbi:MAG: DNA topoisomerase VI subunit B [Phycisphaerales bacterium]|nr:DNA topoisomerase VI subunit B [Phycisphaerales bacterium]
MEAPPTSAAQLLPSAAEDFELSAAQDRVSKKKNAAGGGGRGTRATAESMAAKQRDISVSEFFAKNRHLLGFDNPRKALLTTVKEAVDNSLDACEEAGILPDITVVIEDLQPDRPASAKTSRYRITVVDNGPGIVRKQVENVFGRLLFGSKFHRLKMSRGQQGIGISAAGMYGLITTGKPMMIQTRPDARKRAHHIELAMNTKTNRAEVTVDEETDDFPLARLRNLSADTRDLATRDEFLSQSAYPTGTCVSIELEGKYQKGRGSIDEFLELTAIANPHARFTLVRPSRTTDDEDDVPLLKKKGQAADGKRQTVEENPVTPGPIADSPVPIAPSVTTDLGTLVVFPRGVSELPPETKEIQPHPRGVELGTLLQMLKDFELAEGVQATLYSFLQEKFCRVSSSTAASFCKAIGVTSRTRASDIEPPQAEKLHKEFMEARLSPPPTDCLAPIGVQQMLKGMHKGVRAEFYAASSREAAVYRGRPFLIEAAVAFGGQLPADDSARIIRFANRVPLLFQQSACSSFKGVSETNWRNYDLQQPRGGVPVGPLVVMIHMASVWVPFTSESKEAIADYDEIRKEMKLALMECGRKLGAYLRKRAKMRREGERRDVFERYIGEIASAIHAINGADAKKLYEALQIQAKKRTAIADLELNDEGKAIKEEDPADQEGVLIIDDDRTSADAEATPTQSAAEVKEEAAVAKKAKKAVEELKAKRTSSRKKAEPDAPLLKGVPPTPAPAKPSKSSATAPAAKASAPTPPAASSAKPPKPRMVLDPKKGGLKPVDQGKLF